MERIKISIIICTYNKPKLIEKCLSSILQQEFDKKYEIILVDGGSDKKTLELLKFYENNYSFIRLLYNKKKLPEGYGRGKWLGSKESRGEIIGIIDQDNELIQKNSLKKIEKLFESKEIFGVHCRLAFVKQDSLTNKCISFIGTDPVLAYRSVDGIINNYLFEKKEKNNVVNLRGDYLLVSGGNCFFYRKNSLEEIGGYVQDIDNLVKLVKKGHKKIIVPKVYTHHKAVRGFFDFIKKKRKWAKTYSKDKREFSWIPKTKKERREFIKNFYNICLFYPLLFESSAIFLKTKRFESFFIPIFKLLTFLIYITNINLRNLKK